MIITGIGSRQTPIEICHEMTKIGRWVLENNHTLRLGHADGADYAFEQGTDSRCIAYLPWTNFNSHLISNSTKIVVENQADYFEITRQFHPRAENLSKVAIKLMNRNACQVMGLYLNRLTNLVVCWTDQGLLKGGTAQAIKIAKFYNIPVFNMYFDEYNTADKVIKKIEQIYK